MFHWTEDEYAKLTTFTSLLSVFSSLVLLPILRSDDKDIDKDKVTTEFAQLDHQD